MTRLHTLMTDTCIAGLRMPVPIRMCHLGSMTSHVDPGSLLFEWWRHIHIREPIDANGPGPGKVVAVEITVREAAKQCVVLQARFV